MQLIAKDVTRQAITLEPNRTLYDSRNSLLRYNISRVVVAKDNKPLGIVTEKDISRFLFREVPNRRLNEIHLDEIMSKNLVVAREGDDLKACASVATVIQYLENFHLPAFIYCTIGYTHSEFLVFNALCMYGFHGFFNNSFIVCLSSGGTLGLSNNLLSSGGTLGLPSYVL